MTTETMTLFEVNEQLREISRRSAVLEQLYFEEEEILRSKHERENTPYSDFTKTEEYNELKRSFRSEKENIERDLSKLLRQRQAHMISLLLELVIYIGIIGLVFSFYWTKLSEVDSLLYEEVSLRANNSPIPISLDKQIAENRYEMSWLLILMAIIAIAPILFRLIYGATPLELLRVRLARERTKKETGESMNLTPRRISSSYNRSESPVALSNQKEHLTNEFRPFVLEANYNAKSIYGRAGVYLLVGSLIAIGGVLFFYVQSQALTKSLLTSQYENRFNVSTALIEYAPRIGTLIFVEAIAFFFLRQYRTNMDEFRYYESIKRLREDQVLMIRTIQEYANNEDFTSEVSQVIKLRPEKLGMNETTELLEAKKLRLKESDFLDKITEMIKAVRK